ncbi:MAG: trehalase family glycosidase [Parvibaculaceae bacterium]
MSSILKTPNVPLARAWNTWDAGRPAEMSFRPLGVRVTPMAYAASAGSATFFPPGPAIRYGAHALDGSEVEIGLTHAGSGLSLRYGKASDYDLEGGWSTVRTGEWGLRVWFVLCLSCDEGQEWRYDEERKVAHATVGPRSVAIACLKPPLLVTGHERLEDVAAEYEAHGYWHLASRAEAGRVLALRFNLDEMPENRFRVRIADRLDLAVEKAAIPLIPAQAGIHGKAGEQGPLAAIRDVIGWNTVWDPVNARPYMTCSRNWDLKKFGGFGMWLNDMCVNGLLASVLDADQGRENLSAVLYGSTPEGNLPCLLTGNDAWVDRTQSPIASLIVWLIWLRTRSRALLEASYPVLARNHAWLVERRDGNGNGLLEFGSSDTGRGLYQGTKLAAKDESFMDNSPLHDEAAWKPDSRTLDCEDVGLNCLATLDAEMLSLIAAELGRDAEAARLAKAAEKRRVLIRDRLWDKKRAIFANRLWSGKFVRSLAPTSFYPLLCGAATREQQETLLAHLKDPKKFGGRFGLPSVSRDDPAYGDNVYWRGRIWPLLNFLVWLGLKRSGLHAEADNLAAKGYDLFEAEWAKRLCPENYNAETGEGLDQPDTDGFYSWSALLPFMQAARAMDFSPWDSWEVVNAGEDLEIGPLLTPAGRATLTRRAGSLALRVGERVLFETNIRGRIARLELGEGRLSLRLPEEVSAKAWIRLPQVSGASLRLAQAGKRDLKVAKGRTGVQLALTAADAGKDLVAVWR